MFCALSEILSCSMARQRKPRLAVHRKNEFRKKYAKWRNYGVAVSPCLVVNVPLVKVKPKSLDIQLQAPEPDELSKECLISISRNVVEEMPASSVECLAQRLQAMPDIIEGTHSYSLCFSLTLCATCTGWIIFFSRARWTALATTPSTRC